MNRVGYLDQAKAWGMFLVYYGHFLEVLLRADATAAFSQWKLIYTFHMPFFFFLTGVFWKPGGARMTTEPRRLRLQRWSTRRCLR